MKRFNLLNKVLNFSAERYFKTAGELFVYEGAYERALALVDKTLALDPENLRAQVLKADILFCLNQDLEALDVLKTVLKKTPTCAEAWMSKAGILDALSRYRDALTCCKTAFQHTGKHNGYLWPMLFDQQMALLTQLKKFREAQQLMTLAKQKLVSSEYNYLFSCYGTLLQQGLRKRAQVRSSRSFRGKALSPQEIPFGVLAN